MREPIRCFMCSTELENGIDTYGNVGEELCRECYNTLLEDVGDFSDQWYGMAPHEHRQFDTGNVSGHITVLIDYKNNTRDENGWYQIAGNLWFRPDEEMEGAWGMWEYREESEAE